MARAYARKESMMFKIKKNVPIPESRIGAERKYPFPDLVSGDCLEISAEPENLQKTYVRVVAALGFYCSCYLNKLGDTGYSKHFVTRVSPKEGCVKVWRL